MKKLMARAISASFAVSLLLALVGCGSSSSSASAADSYPTKNIEIICPYSAGGGSDLFSRSVAEGFNDIFGNTTIVTNKTGGNGQIGAAYAFGKKADAYTIMSANSGDVGGWMDAQIDYFDFQPIGIIAYDVNVLVVNANSPYQTMDDLVKAAKANPRDVVFGGTIVGSGDQILCQMLLDAADLKSEYVPFEGGGDVSSALLGGHITAAWVNPAEAIAQMEANKLRVLAVASEKRLETLPEIPTTVECGYPDLTFGQFRGLVAGKDVDPAIVEKLSSTLKTVSESEKFLQFAQSKHWIVTYENSEEMKTTIEKQDQIVRNVLGKDPVSNYEW